jgi:hypothetical protein
MTGPAPLLIGPRDRMMLAELVKTARAHPVEMSEVMRKIATDQGRMDHLRQMSRQTVCIPGVWDFFVTFCIEHGHKAGTCRHMSMSINRPERTPSPEAMWMVAEILGFTGSLRECGGWLEDIGDGQKAVNVVQPLAPDDPLQAQKKCPCHKGQGQSAAGKHHQDRIDYP